MAVMNQKQIETFLSGCRESSGKNVNDGTRLHIHYTAMRNTPSTGQAKVEADRASELGLPKDRFTGRINRVFISKAGDKILNLMVELERDHKFRSLNLTKGKVHNMVLLGD